MAYTARETSCLHSVGSVSEGGVEGAVGDGIGERGRGAGSVAG